MLSTFQKAFARAFALCLVMLLWLLLTQGIEGRPARIFWTRLALELAAAHLAVLALAHRERVRAHLAGFFGERAGPLNLAVFRIVFFLIVLWKVPYGEIERTATLSRSLVQAPIGMGWLMPWVPIDPEVARLACVALTAAAFTGAIGLFSRTSAAVAALAGFYAFGLPNFFGKVHHSTHHLVLFAVLLAASRSGDALSVDAVAARRRGAPPPGASVAYALPIKMLMLLMSVFYFFPGFYKLWVSGIDWIASDHMIRTMQYKWYEEGGIPALLRPDHYPRLMRLGGLAAVAFELLFPLALFFRPLRHAVVATGFVFHFLTEWLLQISFRPLQLCYVMFVDWERLTGRPAGEGPAPEPRAARPAAVVGSVLVAFSTLFGVMHWYLAWPFSLYPTMAVINDHPYLQTIRLAAHDANGPMPAMDRAVAELKGKLDSSRWNFRVDRFMSATMTVWRLHEVRKIWDECLHLRPELAAAKRLKVYHVIDSLIPEDRPKNPVRERLIYDIGL